MKVALAQICCSPKDRQSNLDKIKAYVEQTSSAGADVVIFPELSDTAYGKKPVRSNALDWNADGSSLEQLSKSAQEHSINIVVGLAEKTGEGIYNSLAVISRSGELLARYRKIHLFTPDPGNEAEYTQAGDDVVSVSIEGCSFGCSICYDLRFPELYRQQAIGGAKVLVNIAAWPEARHEHWTCLARARAIENQCFFLATNRSGEDLGISFAGRSSVFAPNGDLVYQASGSEEEVIYFDLNLTEVDSIRNAIPSLGSRRTDLF